MCTLIMPLVRAQYFRVQHNSSVQFLGQLIYTGVCCTLTPLSFYANPGGLIVPSLNGVLAYGWWYDGVACVWQDMCDGVVCMHGGTQTAHYQPRGEH